MFECDFLREILKVVAVTVSDSTYGRMDKKLWQQNIGPSKYWIYPRNLSLPLLLTLGSPWGHQRFTCKGPLSIKHPFNIYPWGDGSATQGGPDGGASEGLVFLLPTWQQPCLSPRLWHLSPVSSVSTASGWKQEWIWWVGGLTDA